MVKTQDDPINRSSGGSQLEDRKVTMTIDIDGTLDTGQVRKGPFGLGLGC